MDTITASAVVNGTTITSAPVQVHWTAGTDVTVLNLSPSHRAVVRSASPPTLSANLLDLRRLADRRRRRDDLGGWPELRGDDGQLAGTPHAR